MQNKIFIKNSKGDKICTILTSPKIKTDKILVTCHGFSSSKKNKTYLDLEKKLIPKGIAIFRFDFYGHGESDGKFENITLSEAIDDTNKAIDYIKKIGYKNIGLFGSSFGGAVAIITAGQRRDLKLLTLKAPVSDYLGKITAQTSRYPINQWKKDGYINYDSKSKGKLKLNYSFFQDSQKLKEYNFAKKISIPTLIIHGDKDTSVPLTQSKKLHKIIKKSTLVVLPKVGHHFDETKGASEKSTNLFCEFITANLN